MITDISDLARAARRLDVSGTLRAFAAPAGIAFAWIWAATDGRRLLSQTPEFGDDPWLKVGAWALVIAAVVAPFWFLVADWMARRRWRWLSATIGFLAGALGHIVLIGLIAAGAVMFLSDRGDGLLHRVLRTKPEQLAAIAISIGSVLWLLFRTAQVELALSGPIERPLLLGAVRNRSLISRLAFLFGLPSSMWRFPALFLPSFWLLFLARPTLYAGATFLSVDPTRFAIPDTDLPANPTLVDQVAQKLGLATWPVAVATGIGVILLAHALFTLGKRLSARRIWSEDANRAPILFLRSFADDRLDFHRPRFDLVGRWLDLWSFRRNGDEVLIDECAQHGPVVALGRPGEPAPPFGAQRRYTTDAEWQAVIADTALRSRAIVLVAGDTDGLAWEYDLIAREGLLEKTIILIPPASPSSEATRRRLEKLRVAFPGGSFTQETGSAAPVAFMTGDSGTLLMVASPPRSETYLLALRAFFLGHTA